MKLQGNKITASSAIVVRSSANLDEEHVLTLSKVNNISSSLKTDCYLLHCTGPPIVTMENLMKYYEQPIA